MPFTYAIYLITYAVSGLPLSVSFQFFAYFICEFYECNAYEETWHERRSGHTQMVPLMYYDRWMLMALAMMVWREHSL